MLEAIKNKIKSTFKKPSSSCSEENTPPFDFKIEKRLGSAKFRVYLAFHKTEKKYYALKAFPYSKEGLNARYVKETKLAKLRHPHVCKITHTIPEKSITQNGATQKFSFLGLEYAPYGDFYELFHNKKAQLTEELTRTYFHQLVEGLEYLHKKGFAHLDIKCENLLLGEDFNLKITDFDLSQSLKEKKLESQGTVCYRAPEVKESKCTDFVKADIYSLGIVLFIFRSGGIPPHLEETNSQKVNLYELMYDDPKKFWQTHNSYKSKKNFYSESFKQLFQMIVEKDPLKRATISQIKESEWYNQSTLTPEQLTSEIQKIYPLT